jgi:hypothetical protein
MSPADALRDFITPVLTGWRIQFGRWTDGNKTDRYCVIKPAGGLPLELVRRPNFTLTFIGAEGQPDQVPLAAAEAVIAAIKADTTNPLAMQPGEPAFFATDDGRPIFELAISTISD